MPPVSLVMAGTSVRPAPQRRPLVEIKAPNAAGASQRAGAARKPAANAVGARATSAASKRPATAQPTRSTGGQQAPTGIANAGDAKALVHMPAESSTIQKQHAMGQGQLTGDGAAGSSAVDQRLSTELLRILEERSLLQSPQKTSPHKEVAERASEDCPRRPLGGISKTRGKQGAGAATKAPSASRLTPCAPSEPKISSHARKTVKAATRNGVPSRPQTAAPNIERPVANGIASQGAGDIYRDSTAAAVKHKSSEPTGAATAHRTPRVGSTSRQQHQNADNAGCSSRERSRERTFNKPASSQERASKEGASTSGAAAPAAAGNAGSGARFAGGQKAVGTKGRSTIADLIARFRNGPPQRPEDRKVDTQTGSASNVFWWQKLQAGQPGAEGGVGGQAISDEESPENDRAGCQPDGYDVRGCDDAEACDDLETDEHESVPGRRSIAKSSSSLDSASSGRPAVLYTRKGDLAALQDAWSENGSQRLEAASRSSQGSIASISRRGSPGASSEAEWRPGGSDSEFLTDEGGPSARGSVESLDHRASLALRNASAVDSTVDASGTIDRSNASSPPSGLSSQMDEAEDLLEQWRAERRARQASAGTRARRSLIGASREKARDNLHLNSSTRTDADINASERGEAGKNDSAVDSAVSRIRRRLGMHAASHDRSAEPGTYPRRMREMTARHSSDSESELQQSCKYADVSRKARVPGSTDPLSKWRGERCMEKRYSNEREPAGRDAAGGVEFRTAMAISSRSDLADPAALKAGAHRDSLPSAEYGEGQSPKWREEMQTTPRSSINSAISSGAEPSPTTPPHATTSRSMQGSECAAPFGSPDRRAAGMMAGGSPRSPRVGGMSPCSRQHYAAAVATTVDKMLFSTAGLAVIDSIFLGIDIETQAGTCAPSCASSAPCAAHRVRVHWKGTDGSVDEPRDAEAVEEAAEAASDKSVGKLPQEAAAEQFHFREVGFARWDSREEESKVRGEREKGSSRDKTSAGCASPELSPTNRFEKTHISIPAGEDVATVRDSPWNKTGRSDEMPRWSHTVWSDNLSKTPGGNSSFSHTRCTHNMSIVENIDASPSHTQTRRTEHNVSIAEAINTSLIEDPQSTSLISEEGPGAQMQTPRTERQDGHGDGKRTHRRGRSVDEDLCILEDLDMADGETGEVFVDRGGGIRGGVSPKTCGRAHGWDEDLGDDDDMQDEDDAIVRALRQRMQQISSEIAALRD